MQEQLTEKQVLDSFVKHILSIHNIPWSGDVSYPDKKNSKSPDIDAIASPFAIEHTSIDFLPHQRQSDQRFLKFIDGLTVFQAYLFRLRLLRILIKRRASDFTEFPQQTRIYVIDFLLSLTLKSTNYDNIISVDSKQFCWLRVGTELWLMFKAGSF